MKEDRERNAFFIQDLNINDKTITNKIFRYFYSLFQEKKEFNSFFKYLQIIIETIQLISYAFSSNHFNSWKLEEKSIKTISNILGGFRLSILMKFVNFNIYAVIFYILIIIIFIFCLIVVLQILFIDSTSVKYRFSTTIIRAFIDIISIIFFIPITEIILMPIKCEEGIIKGIKNSEKCWEDMHYLYFVLGIMGAIFLFIWCIFMLFFSFYPFQKIQSTIRIKSDNDIFIIIIKLFLILQNIFISNQYLSITILFILSIIITITCYYNPTYNNHYLESAITIKNLMIIWTYFVLFLSKIFETLKVNGFIYLLVFGYPGIIYLSFVICKEKDYNGIYFSENIQNLNDCIEKAQLNIKLINSFIDRNQTMRNGNEIESQRNNILLKGNIEFHCMTCSNKDCPLMKFLKNEGNFNVQRQCLLNYMNLFFNKGFKRFPKNIPLLILYIQFNYSKRFNLNNTKTNLLQLKKLESSIKEKYIIYCMEQTVKNINNNNVFGFNNENELDNESQIDISEQKYQKLKYLIENSIRLFGEFWGIFSTNITSNINSAKLYTLGEKLNKYLQEINYIWDHDLKNKKISNECQSIAQLYSKFLLEILWDRKKSREVAKKLNDENINDYHLNDNKKLKEEKVDIASNLESIVDNQDYILFCNFDEKGNFRIMKCSESFSQLLGYEKYDILGKSLEIIFPNVLVEAHLKYLEECIQSSHNDQNNQKDFAYSQNDLNKNAKIIIVKSRMGYIVPLYASVMILEDTDYSDSVLVKLKMETRSPKSEYAFYILSNPDLSIENISSSAINLGLSLDLLKKYLVKMDVLVRTEKDTVLNIFEKINEYEEEPKIVTWVFPDIIYPKDNMNQNKDEDIDDLIDKSDKIKFNLLIRLIRFNENKNLGFAFKFTEIYNKKKKKFIEENFIPDCKKKLIMFDLINLKYIRAYLVDKKTGLRNLRSEENIENEKNFSITKLKFKKHKKRKKSSSEEIEESSEDDGKNNNKNNNILTKEKIIELQVHKYTEIKEFIFSLQMYGKDISLERFRPNGEKYSASKVTEPSIKIQISNFCKKIEEKVRLNQSIKKRKHKNIFESNESPQSPKTESTDDYLSMPNITSSHTSKSGIVNQGEEINKGFSTDSFSTLSNILKVNSVKYIKIFITFFFAITIILLLIEFLISYTYINKLSIKINFLDKSFIILNDMLYSKYFITEGVIANEYSSYLPIRFSGKTSFFENIKNELSFYREEFSETYDDFTSNELCKEYKNFMSTKRITLYTITIDIHETLNLLFNSVMSRITAGINNIATNENLMIMTNRDTYELMYNLINEYYINWQNVIFILFNDCIKATKLKIPLLVILISYLLVSLIIFILFLKLLSKFSLDREKPINLFLTLKKQVFENLKTSAENFSNKLLNKFFGNEEIEEESQQDYQANIQSSDINIAKFKAANESSLSINRAFDFTVIIIIILIFFIINLIYFISTYLDFRGRMENISQFVLLLEKTHNAQIDFVLSLDIFKSYLYNNKIPILNNNKTREIFIDNYLLITHNFENSIIYTSKTSSFLSGAYLEKYRQYLYGDFRELLDSDYLEENKDLLGNKINNGLKPVQTRVFEIVRYFTLKYFGNEVEEEGISFILKSFEFKLFEINIMLQYTIRIWYKNVLKLMIKSFKEFQNRTKLIYIIIFICFLVILVLYYFIVWKMYEEKLNVLLKGSSDLINLIPQEIKNIIIEKLNE